MWAEERWEGQEKTGVKKEEWRWTGEKEMRDAADVNAGRLNVDARRQVDTVSIPIHTQRTPETCIYRYVLERRGTLAVSKHCSEQV